MIDYFSLALAHGLIVIALWRMSGNAALDDDPALPAPKKIGFRGVQSADIPPLPTAPGHRTITPESAQSGSRDA